MIHALRLRTGSYCLKRASAPTQRAPRAPRAGGGKPPHPFWPSMVKEAKDTEMAMAKAVEGSEHDLEPRKLEYSPSRKPRLAPDPPELGDTRVGSIALMAFCFVGLQVPRCPPSILTLLRARTLCNPPHLQRLPRPLAPCCLRTPAAAACPVTRTCSMPAPCSRPLRPSRPRAFTPAAARRTGLLPHVGLPAGEGGHDRAPSPSPSPSP